MAVAFKTGLFNIGAPGQYLAGTAATLFIALSIPSSVVPPEIIWFLAFFGGMLAGALWGAIPGMLEVFAQHQRGAGLHHDQLDRSQPCDMDL